ncbi:MAG: hypothetical protein HOL41_08185 [Rhodospirillaceae bacterium]|nr:hypothetical protein [Rhodospirillaceae bacterium]
MTKLVNVIDAWVRILGENRLALIVLAVYLGVIFTLRVALFPGASEDDAEQLYYAQSWAWGYKANQPPLYTWMVMALQSFFGVQAASVVAIKYSALGAMYVFYYLAALRMLSDRRTALVATLTVLGFYYIAWDMAVNYSNTALLAAAIAGSLWAFMRIHERPTIARYAVFGLFVAAGLLAKFNYALFVLPLLMSALFAPGHRDCMVSWKIFATVFVAVALAGPYYFWFFGSADGLASANVNSLPTDATSTYLADITKGLWGVFRGGVSILMPGFIIAAAILWPARSLAGQAPRQLGAHDNRRLLGAYIICVIVALILGVGVSRVSAIQAHWMIVLLPVPIFAATWLDPARISAGRFRAFVGVFTVLALCVPLGLAVRAGVAPETCKKCNFFFPHSALSRQIEAAGFQRGTIIAMDYPNILSGNLRRYFPDSRVVSGRFLPYLAPTKIPPGKCLIIWNATRGKDLMDSSRLWQLAKRHLRLAPPLSYRLNTAEARIHGSAARTKKLGFVILENNLGDCR